MLLFCDRLNFYHLFVPPVTTVQQWKSCKALNSDSGSVVHVVASQREGSRSLNPSLRLFLPGVNPDGALEQGFNSRSGSGSTAPTASSSSGMVHTAAVCDKAQSK